MASKVARDWKARGYSCGLFADPPAREWNDFVHNTNEVVAVVKGKLETKIEGVRFQMGPGAETYSPGGALHSVRNRHTGVTRWLYG